MAKPTDLLSVDVARRRILDHFHPLEVERVSLLDALGRVAAERVISELNLPPFANSSMDGFAVEAAATQAASTQSPAQLTVVDTIPAGAPLSRAVPPESAARIMTGASLPSGADAVIPFEDVVERDGTIIVSAPVTAGACVRPLGNDLAAGTVLLEPGEDINARTIGLLAATGHDTVTVTRRPKVAVLATGNELVPPGRPLGPGQIYNSNTPMLLAAILEAGAVAVEVAAAVDDPGEIAAALNRVDADLLVTSGGASVGDFDYVKDVVGEGGSVSFWRVAIRPGKPLLFGTMRGRPLIGLPGNPTSAMVTFQEFVRPAIRRMLGASHVPMRISAVLDESIDNRGGRRTYARVRLSTVGGQVHARPSGRQDSAMLLTLARADGLLIIPEDQTEMKAGETGVVEVWNLPGDGRSPDA